MTITIEPGCYFVDFMLDEKFDIGFKVSDYVNVELAKEYAKEVSGVRIEDCVVVTSTGVELLNQVPRSIAQIEACMRGEKWETIPDEVFEF